MVNTTLHNLWGRLYFPVFLLGMGLLTLRKMGSSMALARLYPFPAHSVEALHHCVVACAGLVVIYEWRCLYLFCEPFPKCSGCLSNVLYCISICLHPHQQITSLFSLMLSFSFGITRILYKENSFKEKPKPIDEY